MPVTHVSVVVRSDEPMSASVKNALVLFSEERGKYFVLDDIAATIWPRLEAPMAVADLCQELEVRFAVEPDQCRRDVVAFLNALESRGLIRVIG